MGTMDIAFSGVKYAALLLVPAYLLVLIYRVLFHPLKDYPGPLAAKLSDLYPGFYAISRSLHLATFEDQRKYGPVMRYGPKKLVFNSAEALQDIYNNQRVTKSHVYALTGTGGRPSIFSAIDQNTHRVKRRVIGQAVSDKAIRAFEPTLTEQVDIFIEKLLASSQASQPVNMTDRCKRLGLDIVGFLAFGFGFNTQSDSTNRFVLRALGIGSYRNYCFMQFPLLKKLRIHNLLGVLGRSQRQKFMALLQRVIKLRVSEGKHAKNDLYSFLVDHINDDLDFQTSDIWAEALFFFPAAGDTTSTTISALFFYLSRNRDVYRKLAEEIRRTFESNSEIRGGPQLASCRYLRACIDETLRISPPVTGTPWRELYAEEEGRGPWMVDGHVIPPGTQVGVCMYSIHHNEKYFVEPFAFRPERWLDDDQETQRLMNSAFSPFSLGPRGCAGKSMAYLETNLVLAKTLWYFDFEKAPGKAGQVGAGVPGRTDGRGRPDEFQLYDQFGSQHDGPNLVFRPRGDLWKEIGTKAPSNV